MGSEQDYDVIIIGTGAGGGTLARHLAPSGKRILLLERGDFLPREKQNWDDKEVWLRKRYISKDLWRDGKNKQFNPDVYYYVGGSTKMYGAALFRFRKEDFGELRHHGGISPAWPISYEQIEPYYSQAEHLYRAHGLRGADPTEPEASAPYPFPPLRHSERVQELFDGFTRQGYHPFPLPVGVMRDEQSPQNSQCIRCNTCDGHPCLVHAKCDSEVIGVRPALQHANVTLVTDAEVRQLKTNPSGREVTEVVVHQNGENRSYAGSIVVVSAGASNSARLLLMSANDKHPRGLANGSDQVGRNFMYHNVAVLMAFSARPNPTQFQKTLAVNDFYFGMDDFPYPVGNIQMFSKSKGEMFRRVIPPIAPRSAMNAVAHHAIDFTLLTEDLPDPKNRITVNPKGEIQINYQRNNYEPMRRLQAKLKSMLSELSKGKGLLARNVYVVHPIPLTGIGHQLGTCRFGADPATSVLDENCKAHELENLYVVDTSFFPSSAAVNPSLTAMANALRVGDHILARLGVTQ